ncbi:hypothetical protein ACJIZ3_018590 [Penstemon smallii]|uniref:Uncharacterized protein n=1 Tax=Penstemon smallii TaxID=265156 RepID=A0ABD3T071_9LAMI
MELDKGKIISDDKGSGSIETEEKGIEGGKIKPNKNKRRYQCTRYGAVKLKIVMIEEYKLISGLCCLW